MGRVNEEQVKMNNNILKQTLLDYFFEDPENRLYRYKAVVEKETEYSLRILEWFVSNYSKKYNVVYEVKGGEINVFLDYKNQLKSFNKKSFDPFKRRQRFTIDCSKLNDKSFVSLESTVGQLNFFRWAIENKVLDYVAENYLAIKDDMNCSVNYASDGNGSGSGNSSNGVSQRLVQLHTKTERKKRQPLSQAATRTCVKRYTKVLVTFD